MEQRNPVDPETTSISIRKLRRKQIFRPHNRYTESETWDCGPVTVVTSQLGDQSLSSNGLDDVCEWFNNKCPPCCSTTHFDLDSVVR